MLGDFDFMLEDEEDPLEAILGAMPSPGAGAAAGSMAGLMPAGPGPNMGMAPAGKLWQAEDLEPLSVLGVTGFNFSPSSRGYTQANPNLHLFRADMANRIEQGRNQTKLQELAQAQAMQAMRQMFEGDQRGLDRDVDLARLDQARVLDDRRFGLDEERFAAGQEMERQRLGLDERRLDKNDPMGLQLQRQAFELEMEKARDARAREMQFEKQIFERGERGKDREVDMERLGLTGDRNTNQALAKATALPAGQARNAVIDSIPGVDPIRKAAAKYGDMLQAVKGAGDLAALVPQLAGARPDELKGLREHLKQIGLTPERLQEKQKELLRPNLWQSFGQGFEAAPYGFRAKDLDPSQLSREKLGLHMLLKRILEAQ